MAVCSIVPGPVANRLRGLRAKLRQRHTVRAHAWQSLANYAQHSFGLIFGMVLARLLTPGDFGAYGFAFATVILALLPANWTLAQALVADNSRTPSLYGFATGFGWSVAIIRLFITGGLMTWFMFTGREQMAWLCLVIGATESLRELNNIQRGWLEGQGNFKPNFAAVVTNVIFCIVVVIPISFLHWGPYVLTLPSLGGVVTDFLIYRYFTGRSIFIKPKWAIPREFLHSSFWLWLNVVADIMLLRFDKWCVGSFRGTEPLGHYNRAFGYAPLSHLVLSSLITNPTVTALARCENAAGRGRLFRRTALILLAGGMVNWTVFFFFSRPVVLLLFGPQWEKSIPVFEAFASLSIAYAVAYLPVTAMYAAGRFSETALVRLGSLAFFAGIAFAFRENLSVTAVAWSIQAVLVVQGLILFVRCRHYLTPSE